MQLTTTGGRVSAGLRARLASLARSANRTGWEFTHAEVDVATRQVRIEAVRGALSAPNRRVIVIGTWDRAHFERFTYARGREPRGRRGDRYMSETCAPVFLGRDSGHLRDVLRSLGAYFAENLCPALVRSHYTVGVERKEPMTQNEMTIAIDATRVEYFEDCLQAAVAFAVSACPELDGWDLEPCWGEGRWDVLLTIPLWAWGEAMADAGFCGEEG